LSSLITPIVAAIGGQPDFSALTFQINGSTVRYGAFIDALITFLIIAILMFLVVKGTLRAFREKPAEYIVETYDAAAINARSVDGWEVVSAGDGGVVKKCRRDQWRGAEGGSPSASSASRMPRLRWLARTPPISRTPSTRYGTPNRNRRSSSRSMKSTPPIAKIAPRA
jgi:hypothetical protein